MEHRRRVFERDNMTVTELLGHVTRQLGSPMLKQETTGSLECMRNLYDMHYAKMQN